MKHWVFDLDGTLVDSFPQFFTLMEDIFRDHGRAFGPELRLPALTEPLVHFFARELGEEALKPALAKLQARSNLDAAEVRPFDGIPDLLEGLRASGARVGVWTNRDLVSANLILKSTGLDRFVEACVSGTCVRRRKPDPEGLWGVLRQFGGDATNSVMIGDHEHDVLGAKSAGVVAVRAHWHGHWPTEPCRRADHQFHTATDFAAWARKRLGRSG